MKVLAPGKLILSGEHAVVYGKPALAMAVNRYVTATTIPQKSNLISFDLSDLKYERGLTLTSLEQLKNRIKDKYHRFVHGDFKIREVLQKPFELAQFALSLCLEMLNVKLTQGIQIHVKSTIPVGCGMGSSAATILSILHAITHHVGVDLSPETFLRLGLEAENMQHGTSSGLDLKLSLYGGCRYLKDKQVFSRDVPTIPMYLVNTGRPKTSTGECVAAAAPHFATSTIGDDFAAVTEAMDLALNPLLALQRESISENIKQVIRENHQLLIKIGVVPDTVQQFIAKIEQMNGAAKICGSGAVEGSNAGVVLILIDDEVALKKLSEQFHYEILSIAGESRGVHVII